MQIASVGNIQINFLQLTGLINFFFARNIEQAEGGKSGIKVLNSLAMLSKLLSSAYNFNNKTPLIFVTIHDGINGFKTKNFSSR